MRADTAVSPNDYLQSRTSLKVSTSYLGQDQCQAVAGGSCMQTRAECFQGFCCCNCVDDCPGEKGVPVGLIVGSLWQNVTSTGPTVATL